MLKFIKLVNGEELVSSCEDAGNQVYLVWPARVFMSAPKDGEETPQTQVIPFAAHVKGHSVYIDKDKILYMAEPIPTLAEYYQKTYGSMVPSKFNDESPVDTEQGEQVNATTVEVDGVKEEITQVVA